MRYRYASYAESIRVILIVVLFVLLGLWVARDAAAAEEPTPFQWASHQAIPSRISDAAVAVNLGLDAWQSLVRTDSRRRWGFACRTGLTIGIAEVTKRLVHRTRPNGSDRMSFFSEHTALATSSTGSPLRASLALTVAWGRQAGGNHFASDVAVGVGVGLLSRKVCR